ncbi:MAG: hypothetical protein IJZ42_08920 [Lachnospiraceae bacterium]|nr:hypothetical protein [Lachnospiraceae bacterium]
MEYTNERDFKYVMQDTSHVFMGGRMTYEDMMTYEEVPFKIKAIVNKYFSGKEEAGLAETLRILEQEDFRYQVLKQLKIKIKAGTYQMKKNLFGKEEKRYVSKVYHLDEYLQIANVEKELVTEEFVISKLALMAFSL